MLVEDAQREVRTVFVGGFWGQLVSSAIWLVSAALGTWATPRAAILAAVFGGFFHLSNHTTATASSRRACLSH